MEEIVEYALSQGVALVQMSALPMITTDGENEFELWTEDECNERIQRYMAEYDMLMIGPSVYGNKIWHVVAWDHEKQLCYDSSAPEPLKKPTIGITYFYLALRLNS